MEEQPETQNNLSIFPAASTQPRQPQPYLRPDGKLVRVKSIMRSNNLCGCIRMQNNKITMSKGTVPSGILHQFTLTKGDRTEKRKDNFLKIKPSSDILH